MKSLLLSFVVLNLAMVAFTVKQDGNRKVLAKSKDVPDNKPLTMT